MHRTETQADRRHAGSRAARNRHEAQAQDPRRTVKRQGHGADQQRGDQRKPQSVALDGGARIDREHAGPGQQQFGLAAARLRERAADRAQHAFLGVDVVSRGAGLRYEQRPAAVAGKPYAIPGYGPRLPFQPLHQLDQLDQLAGRIVGQRTSQQHAGGRGQQLQVLLQARAQPLRRKAPGRNGRAQQIAIAPQEFPVFGEPGVLAVADGGQAVLLAQRRSQPLADPRQCFGRRTLDSDQDETRHHAVAQLLDQQLLRGRRRARQEGGNVGCEGCAGDDCDARRDEDEPGSHRPFRRAAHSASPAIVITERSPCVSMISMVPIRLRLPPMRISLTTFCMSGSTGFSVRRHWRSLPSRATW